MPVIYCLFATSDGRPRYVGQTTKPIKVRLDQHIRTADRLPLTPLQCWIRDTMERGFQVRAHVLQLHVPTGDLDLFERYWMSQFPGLLNDRARTPRAQAPTKIALAVERALQGLLSPPLAVHGAARLPAVMPTR